MSPVPSVNPSLSPAPAPVKANAFVAFFGSQAFHALYHAVLVSVIGFLSTNGLPAGDDWAKWVAGLGGAALGAVVGWLNGVAAVKKIGLFLLCFLLASAANAGFLMPSAKPALGRLSLSLPAGTAFYLMPIEGFQVGANLPSPTYGVSLNEDIVYGEMGTLNGTPNLSPIFGVGASLYADGSGVLNGSGPLILMAGMNAVGPDLDLFGQGNGQGLVPNILYTYDFVAKSWKVTGGLTVFLDLGPGTATKL